MPYTPMVGHQSNYGKQRRSPSTQYLLTLLAPACAAFGFRSSSLTMGGSEVVATGDAVSPKWWLCGRPHCGAPQALIGSEVAATGDMVLKLIKSGSKSVRIVSAYRPNKGRLTRRRQGSGSVWRQHRRNFRGLNRHGNPRALFDQDVCAAIKA